MPQMSCNVSKGFWLKCRVIAPLEAIGETPTCGVMEIEMAKLVTQLVRATLGPVLFAGIVASIAPAHAATVTLANSSFEQATIGRPRGTVNNLTFSQLNTTAPGWDVFNGLQGWTVSGGGGNRVELQSDKSSSVDAQDGDYYLSLDTGNGRNSTISQSVTLSTGRYVLSFWYSPESAIVATNTIGYNLGNLISGNVSVGTNGAQVGVWTEVRQTFTVLTGASLGLSFSALGAADGVGGYIDNVSIAVASVPVPASGLALISALGGLLGLRRRRRALSLL